VTIWRPDENFRALWSRSSTQVSWASCALLDDLTPRSFYGQYSRTGRTLKHAATPSQHVQRVEAAVRPRRTTTNQTNLLRAHAAGGKETEVVLYCFSKHIRSTLRGSSPHMSVEERGRGAAQRHPKLISLNQSAVRGTDGQGRGRLLL
jgi:hypothetical protein